MKIGPKKVLEDTLGLKMNDFTVDDVQQYCSNNWEMINKTPSFLHK